MKRVEDLLPHFKNGEERYRKSAVFNSVIHSLAAGQDPMVVLDTVTQAYENLKKSHENLLMGMHERTKKVFVIPEVDLTRAEEVLCSSMRQDDSVSVEEFLRGRPVHSMSVKEDWYECANHHLGEGNYSIEFSNDNNKPLPDATITIEKPILRKNRISFMREVDIRKPYFINVTTN